MILKIMRKRNLKTMMVMLLNGDNEKKDEDEKEDDIHDDY